MSKSQWKNEGELINVCAVHTCPTPHKAIYKETKKIKKIDFCICMCILPCICMPHMTWHTLKKKKQPCVWVSMPFCCTLFTHTHVNIYKEESLKYWHTQYVEKQ